MILFRTLIIRDKFGTIIDEIELPAWESDEAVARRRRDALRDRAHIGATSVETVLSEEMGKGK